MMFRNPFKADDAEAGVYSDLSGSRTTIARQRGSRPCRRVGKLEGRMRFLLLDWRTYCPFHGNSRFHGIPRGKERALERFVA